MVNWQIYTIFRLEQMTGQLILCKTMEMKRPLGMQ